MRYDAAETSVWEYSREVMQDLSRDFSDRVRVDDPFVPFRAQMFLRQADMNVDGFVDRFELENQIRWQVDRNHDERIDSNERQQAWVDFGFPPRKTF